MASKRVFKGGSAASALFSGQEGNKKKLFSLSGRLRRAFPFPSLAAAGDEGQCWHINSLFQLLLLLFSSYFLSSFRPTSPSHRVLIASSALRNSGQNVWNSSEVRRDEELHFHLKGDV